MVIILSLCLLGFIIAEHEVKVVAQATDCIYEDDKCFSFSKELLTFEDAEASCQKQGATLIVPVSRNLLVILATEMEKKKLSLVWIGLNDRKTEGKWVYSNGTEMGKPSFALWNVEQPNSSFDDEDCAVLESSKAKLNDERCSNKFAFICEKPVAHCNMKHILIKHAVFKHCREDMRIPHGTKIKIDCVDGFVRKGTESVTCVNGSWTKTTNCTVRCPPPELPASVTMVQPLDFYFSGDQMPIICDDGFFTYDVRPTSHWNITCTDDGTWDPPDVVCAPASQFIYFQKTQVKNVIKVQPGQAINLACIQTNPPEEAFIYMWMKNQQDITNMSVSNPKKYHLAKDGALTLSAFADSDQGLYMCFIRNRHVILPGQIIFSLKRASPCGKAFPMNTAEVQEGASALLSCVRYDSQSSTAPVWLKDELRIWNSKHRTVLINGGLLVGNLTFADAGEYKCQYVDDNMCSRNVTTKLVVVPSSKNMCGLTTYNSHPWIISLWWDKEDKPFCYGAILNGRWVITSAVCVFGLSKRNLQGIYVQLNIDESEVAGNEVGGRRATGRISSFAIHPDFSMRIRSANLALLQLELPLKFTHIFFPVCIANEALLPNIKKVHDNPCHPSSGLEGYAGGMGNLGKLSESKGARGNTMRKDVSRTAEFEYVTIGMGEQCISSTCTKAPMHVMCTHHDQVPASYITDTGSPLYIKDNQRSYLVGILNWVEDSGDDSVPDYYTPIIPYNQWIQNTITERSGRSDSSSDDGTTSTVATKIGVGQEDGMSSNSTNETEKTSA